jgi:hypothetical protein
LIQSFKLKNAINNSMLSYTIPPALRGDTWSGITSITITNSGVPISLSGALIKMQLREDLDAPVALELSTTNGLIVITNPLSGVFQIPPQIINIPFDTYNYDIQVTFPNGTVTTYIAGTWQITPDITQ